MNDFIDLKDFKDFKDFIDLKTIKPPKKLKRAKGARSLYKGCLRDCLYYQPAFIYQRLRKFAASQWKIIYSDC